MEFDRTYLDMDQMKENRARRDGALSEAGVEDIEWFKTTQRRLEVENECDTDEYRETQPSKGLSFIAEFMEDGGPGVEANTAMLRLVAKWFNAMAEAGAATSYAGAEELKPILEACFDYRWECGFYSLYQPYVTSFEDVEDHVKWYHEEEGGR